MPDIVKTSRTPVSSERLSLDAVYEIAKILTSVIDPVRNMPSVLNILSSFMELKHGALALLAEAQQSGASGKRNPYMIVATTRSTEVRAPDCGAIPPVLCETVFRTGVPMMVMDVAAEIGPDALPPDAVSDGLAAIAVPVRDPKSAMLVLGVLCAYRSHDDMGAGELDKDMRVLSMVASLLEQALRFRRTIVLDRERMMADARLALKAAQDREAAIIPEPAIEIDGIVGDSPEISAVIERIRKVAITTTPILLRGESGTGKELFARAIHTLSERADRPFIKVNCAALSESLLETELFGHEKGSFTGAMAQKKGRFELAHTGTLFLDEIGEISQEFQAKLLRVLQEGEFERVGGTRTLNVDVRLITATNRDLESAVAKGEFRADLYFRICVVPIMLPPLRERPSDIPQLAQTFLDKFNGENGTALSFAENAFDTLNGCKFPGNVRELENCVCRAAALAGGPVITAADMACQQGTCLSAELWRLQTGTESPIGGLAAGQVIHPTINHAPRRVGPPSNCPVPPQPRKTADTERQELVDARARAGWVQAKAARLLGMTPRQIGYALKKHGVEVRKF